MEKLLTTLVSEKLRTYAAITLMFTYTFLLGRDFECTCEPQVHQCNVYMGLPIFIILLLILLTDRSFQRVCRYLCSCAGCCMPTTCNFCGSFFRHFLKAVLVGLLWVAFVLLEGDWYVCCENNHSEQQALLACKAKDNITEKERVIIAELRNTSRVYGSFTLFGIVVVALLSPLFRKCCGEKSSCCNRRFLYDKLILEEEDNVLKEIFRKLAKDQLTIEVKDRIHARQWEECFNVAVGQINAAAIPTFKEQQKRRNEQENPSPGNSTGQENPSPGTSTNQENPSPGNSPSQEDPSPGTSPSLPLIKKKDNKQHEEQEDGIQEYGSTNV